jgi:hypothetical protein
MSPENCGVFQVIKKGDLSASFLVLHLLLLSPVLLHQKFYGNLLKSSRKICKMPVGERGIG